ncbi:MAG TPA: hypothetical protein VNH64_11545 [Parvularculaceae bacterium]|nr:hypothetical protein [Parvularculaceae bacterium]
MRILVCVFAVAAFCLAPAVAAETQTGEPAPEAAAPPPDCASVIPASRAAIADKSFATANEEKRWKTYADLANCGLDLARWKDAEEGVSGVLSIDPDNTAALKFRIILSGIMQSKAPEAVDAIERLSKIAPKVISEISLPLLSNVSRLYQQDENQRLRFRFLQALFAADYRPPDPADRIDGVRIEYIHLLLENRWKADAVEQIRLIADPTIVAEFLFDKSYDDLARFPGMPTVGSVAELVAAEVARAKEIATNNPGSMNAAVREIQALRMAGMFDAAATRAAAVVSAAESPDAPSKFADYVDMAPWLYNEYADALYDVGKDDEARAAFSKAATFDENGAPNVSQTINFAEMLFGEGRFDEAQSTIAKLDRRFASPYGKMWASAARVCIKAFKRTLKAGDADLAFVKANAAENGAAFAKAMLCIDDEDAVAAQLIQRLEDPFRRAAALRPLQNTIDPPHSLPIDIELNRRAEAVAARPEVAAAIDKAGRILDLPFYPAHWGEY